MNNDGNVENSGHGRRKRAPHQIGALNGCLCGIVVDPNVDLGDVIQCQQAGCETHWVCFIFPYKGWSTIVNSPVIQYHLQCLELEQVPVKWVCKACKASGEVWAKCSWKGHGAVSETCQIFDFFFFFSKIHL